ncbi:MAG: rod shape-determining protein MreD [Sphingorhabdus sp.]
MKSPLPAMMRTRRSRSRYQSEIDRSQSPVWMTVIPIASVLLASMITSLPIIAAQPLLPPLGLMVFVAWRLMRPGIWPMWAGLPFGLFDDIFSGQPFGSGGLIWSLVMLGMELVDTYMIWRDHWQDWLIGAIIIALALLVGLWFVGLAYNAPGAVILLPQIILSVLLFPLVVRLCARLDSWRLAT